MKEKKEEKDREEGKTKGVEKCFAALGRRMIVIQTS